MSAKLVLVRSVGIYYVLFITSSLFKGEFCVQKTEGFLFVGDYFCNNSTTVKTAILKQ